MKTATFATASAFVASTFLPCVLAQSTKAWMPYISSRGDKAIHGKEIVAWNGQFIVPGVRSNQLVDDKYPKSATVTCPDYDKDCPAQNTTILSGLSSDGSDGTLWMGVLQQGGQKVYWHEAPKGSYMRGYNQLLSYTAASNGPDAGVPATDVVYDRFGLGGQNLTGGHGLPAAAGNEKLVWVSYDGYTGEERRSPSFGLCDVGEGDERYSRLTISSGKYCVGVEVELVETDMPAPQFYGCNGCELRRKGDDLPACQPPFCGDNAQLYT